MNIFGAQLIAGSTEMLSWISHPWEGTPPPTWSAVQTHCGQTQLLSKYFLPEWFAANTNFLSKLGSCSGKDTLTHNSQNRRLFWIKSLNHVQLTKQNMHPVLFVLTHSSPRI